MTLKVRDKCRVLLKNNESHDAAMVALRLVIH